MTAGAGDPRVWVAGTGSFAAEVAEIAAAAGFTVDGLLELVDPARIGSSRHGLPVVGLSPPHTGAAAILGAGGDRPALARRLRDAGWTAPVVVHPAAAVGASARLGPGTVVAPGAIVAASAVTGADVLLSRGVLVGHHAVIAETVTLNPGANVAGNCRVGAGAVVGMGAVVADHVTIGERAIVAAGAVVVRDVAAGSRVQGVPARAYRPAGAEPTSR